MGHSFVIRQRLIGAAVLALTASACGGGGGAPAHRNVDPIADAGRDFAVDERATAQLDGSASRDPDGTIASYQWTQTAGAPVTLMGADQAVATFVAPTTQAPVALTFHLAVTDDQGATGGDDVTVTVNPVNDPPVANDDSAATAEDTTLAGTLTARDVDDTALTFAKASDPAHGVATVNADGTFTYQPATNFSGDDQFTFTANDGKVDSAPATVSITVTDTPEATLGASDASVREDGGSLSFTVTLSRMPDGPVVVHYATADGTARAGKDYRSTSGDLQFDAGSGLSQLVTVPVIDDPADENDETLALNLAVTSGADSVQSATAAATGTIQDNDDSDLLRVGAAKRSITPTQAQIDGIEEERAFGAGARKQYFNLGGFGINLTQNNPDVCDPSGQLPDGARCVNDGIDAVTTTEPATRRVFTDAAGEQEDTNLRLMVIEQPNAPACEAASSQPGTVTTCSNLVVFAMIDAIGAGNIILEGAKNAIIAAGSAQGVTIRPENILFGMTHSHTAADLQGLWGGVPQDWINNVLYKAAGEAATEALKNRVASHLSFRQGYTTAFNNYRRPRIDPNADADGTLTLLEATADDGTPVGSILQYNAHPTTVGDGNEPRTPHSEYILGAMEWLEGHEGGTSLYYNGPIADASPSGSRAGCRNLEHDTTDADGNVVHNAVFGDVRCRGEGIADYLLHDENVLVKRELAPTLTARSTQAVLPVTNPAFVAAAGAGVFNRYYNFAQLPIEDIPGLSESQKQDLPQVAPVAVTTVSRVTIGGEDNGLEIVTIPGETTNTNADYIRKLARTKVMLLGLTHNSFGYILPEEEFSYVDQEGDDGFVLPFTGYEEYVSLGPLTATLLRAEAYNPLFGAPVEKDVPPAVSSCTDASAPTTCALTMIEERLNLLVTSVEACFENGPTGDGCPLQNALDMIGIGHGTIPGVGPIAEPVVDTRLTTAQADALARGCDILDTSECLFPFPSDHFLVPAAPGSPQGVESGGTGKRVNFNVLAMPRNLAGKPIDPTEWNRNDGFSPGQLIVTYVPDIGTVKGANGLPLGPIQGAVPITDLPRYLDDDAPIMVLDADTGERHPVYAEIDLNAGYLLPMQGLGPRADKKPALLIRPAKNFAEGHRYVVVLRNLKKDNGEPIFAAPAFTACRDHAPDELAAMPVVQARCQELDDEVFPVLDRAGVARDRSLYLAWDFTVASAHNDVARITAMRDDAFRNDLGDSALSAPGDSGYPGGHAPKYVITQITENPDGANGKTVRRIQGTLTVPSYVVPADPSPFEGDKQLKDTLHQVADLCQSVTQGNCGVPGLADAGDGADLAAGGSLPPNRLNYLPDATSAAVCDPSQGDPSCVQQARYGDGLPDRNPTGDLTTTFTCNIPRYAVSGKPSMADASAADVRPVRPTLYGHGLLGGQGEGNGQASDFGNVYGLMTCMTDWFGFASGDLGNVASALVDLSNFPVIPDGAQQGVLNMLYLARLAVHPQGFAADPAFQVAGKPVFDRREVFYNGNSQGGIMGGVVIAASKDINRGMLGVLGMNYSTLLARSTDFATYSIPLYLSYQGDLERPFVMSLMQMLWDRAENDGYAEHLTDNSAMGGPGNAVLLTPAIGDHQVTMWSAEVMARTVGAKIDRHRVRPERHPDLDASEYFGLTPVDFTGGEHWTGSALVPYDQVYDPATGTEHWHSQNDGRCNSNRTAPPPIGNVPPNRSLLIGQGPPLEAKPDEFDTDAGADPHECPRRDPQARCQMSHFLLRVPDLLSGDSAPELVDVSDIDIFAPGTDGDAGCPAVVITGAPGEPPPPNGATAGSGGLLGTLGDAWRGALAALAAIPDDLASLPDQLVALAQQAGDQLAAIAASLADAAPGIAQDAAGHAAGGDTGGLTADLQALLSYVVGKPAPPGEPALPPPQPLLAGAAEGAIRVPVGTPLGGYLRPPVGGEYIGDDAQAEALDNIPSQADDGTPLAPLPDELRKVHSPYATASPPSRGYYDSLMAKAVALYDGHDYVVLMKTDFIGSLDEVVQAVADKVKADTGIDVHEGLVISATHTHDGPGALANHSTRYFWAAMDAYQPEVFERLVPQLAKVVEDALSGLEPARFGYAMGEEADGSSAVTGFRTLNSFRRSVDFPSYDNNCSDDGLCNHGLRRRIGVLRVDHADGRPMALVMNYAAHGIAFDVENQYYSGDVLASAEREVEATFPAPAGGGKPVIAMLVQNTGGNVSPRADGGPTLQRIERFGKLLAPQVRAVYDSVGNFDTQPDLRAVSQRIVLSREKLGYPDKDGNDYPYEWGAVQCNNDSDVPYADDVYGAARDATGAPVPEHLPQPSDFGAPKKIPGCLPAPPPDPADLADNGVGENGAFVPQDTRLTAVKIGSAYLLAQPGEPLSEYGVRLLKAARDQEGSDPADTFIWGYSQDHVGYIMADEKADWDQGGTEGTTTFWGWLQGKRLREASIGLLHALKHPDEAPPKNEFEANYFYRNLPYAPAKPTPSAQPGRIVTQPADIKRFGATSFVWEGGDPVLDFPDVAMQVKDSSGDWVVARRANGRPLDRFFEMHLKYRLVSGAHLWTVEFEAPKDWPVGRYRFAVGGKAMQGGTVTYTVTSDAFDVAPSPSLQVSAPRSRGDNTRCDVTLTYTPRPKNYRIVDPLYSSDQSAPVRAGAVTFYAADGSVLVADVPVGSTPGLFAIPGACPAGVTAEGHDGGASPNTSPRSAASVGADADEDGVADADDHCPGTSPGTTVNAAGCPVQGPAPSGDHGLVGCMLTQDPAMCQAALQSLQNLQKCSFDATGFNCAFDVAYDAIGVDTAAGVIQGLFDQCAGSPAAPACEAVQSSGDGAVPDRIVLASTMVERGALEYAEQAPVTPSVKTVDGGVADWMGQPTHLGGAGIFEYGEHVYSDFLFDAYGADDGDDARRLAVLALTGDVSDRLGRLDALQQAAGDQLGVPQPVGSRADHYGDATHREDGTDLTEARWAADGSDLFFLARVARLQNPANLVVVVLADTDDAAAGMNGLDAGLTTHRFDRALVLQSAGARVINLVTGVSQPLADAGGAVAVSAAGYDNALEARIPRALLERADGKLDVAVMTVRQDGNALVPANVAYRPHEPVTIYNERAQAMALFAHTVDPFVETISVADLVGGRTQLARPGPGYHERQFVSGANISNEDDPEQGRLQSYGLYVPHGIGGDALHPARLTIWTHYRGGKAHSGASWTPRLIKELSGDEPGLTSDEPKNLVVTPGARGTSTWYTTRAHQDFFEVFADVAGTLALNQYADENLPADSEATAHGLFAVDPAHVYVSGYSMGGYATYLFTGLYPDLFAGGFSQSGAVTQGAWTGYGPDDAQCVAPAQEIPVEGDPGNLCFVEANDSRADAQLNWRLLDNTRWVPLEINHGTNDELALTPGAVRMSERLDELGYRHDTMLFVGYEHYTQAIMDEWADGAHYINRFARPENPRQVTYKVVPALVKAVNEVQLKGVNGGAPFRFHPDGAYWVDDLRVRDGADGSIPASGVVPFGQIDAQSGRLAGATVVAVPRSGSDADNGPYASTPAYSPGNHTTPYVRSGLDWQETGTLAADGNTFSATLTNLAAATLDLARMGFAGHFDAPIDAGVTSDGAALLTLAHVGADMTVCVGGNAAGSVSAGGDAAITLAAGANAIRLVPGVGASCGAVTPPPAATAAAPSAADVCDAYGVAGMAPLCDGLRSAQSQLAAQCAAGGVPAELCTLSGGNLHALLDACYEESGGSASDHRDGAPLPVCRVVDAFVAGAAAYCRQVSMATADAVRPELCGLIGGVVVSQQALDRYEASWTHKALTLQSRLGFALPLLSSQLLHTHNSFNATDDNTPPTLSGSDFNQYYDIPGQLRMDIRAIEIDVHWMPGRGGSVQTQGFEPMVCHADTDRRTPLGPDPNVGCTYERPLSDVLAELRAWLDAHPDEVMMLYVEDHLTEGNADTTQSYPVTAQVFEQYLGDKLWRTGAEGCDEDADPVAFLRVSREQIAAAGKQLFMISESCNAGGTWNSMFHRKRGENVHQGTQSSFAGFSYDSGCALLDEAGFITANRGARWTRIWEDSTMVTATAGGGAPGSVTPAVAHELMRCGLSLPGFDRLTPADGRLDAAVWSWAPDEPVASATLNCAAQRADGRFVAANCGEARPYACVSNADPDVWQVAGNGAWADAACPSGFHFSVPANGYANEQLRAAANGSPVWLNYTDQAADGQWSGDATPPPPLPGANAPPGSSLGAVCRSLGAPEAACGALDSLVVGAGELAASLTGEAAYDRCLGGVCLSQAPVVGNLALNVLDPLLNDAPRGVWLKGDMHVHDDHSADGSGPRQTLGQGAPGNVSVADQIHFAENVGLDFLPLTDHRTFDQHYDPLWTSDRLLLITGEEANGSPHANVFGATDMINQADNPAGVPEFRKLQQSIWDAQLQGAAWSTNHPDDGELVKGADARPLHDANGDVVPNSYAGATGPHLCEIWNRGTLNRPKIEYCENRWNAGYRSGIAGASDDHFRELWALAGPGEPTTYVFARERSTPALLDALRAGRTGVHLNASAPFVTFEGDFDGDGSFETVMGDEARIAPGAIARLRVTVEHGIGTHVDVYRMPGLKAGPFLTFVPTLPTQRFTFEVQAPRGAEVQDWYRVEVRGPGDPDALDYSRTLKGDVVGSLDPDHANPLRALTSPIFVSTGALARPVSPELPADAGGADGAFVIAGSAADNAFAGFADVAESDGTVHTVAQVRDAGGSKVFYRRRNADGTLADPVDLAPDSRLATLPRIAAMGADVWAVWQDDRDGEQPHRSQIYARHSSDAGETWSAEVLVSASAGRAEHPALALLAPDRPVIVWQDNDGGAFDVLARVLGRGDTPVNLSAEGKRVSAGTPLDTRSAIHPASVRPSVAVSPDGAVVVAWQDNNDDVDPGWTGHTASASDMTDEALPTCEASVQEQLQKMLAVKAPSQPECEFPGHGTQTDNWEIYSRTLAAGADAWSAKALVSHDATGLADRNVTIAFDASGMLHAAWDTKDNGFMAGPRLSVRTSDSSDQGLTWSTSSPVARDDNFSSQRPVFGRNGPTLSLFWMDGRSADWRWRVMRADLRGAAGFGQPRFVTGPGNAAWPAFSNGWLAFTSDRNATREQRKPQQAFLLKLEPAVPAGAAPGGDVTAVTPPFDLCDPVTGRNCLSQAGAVGQALLAALAPIAGPDPNPAQPLDPLFAACRDNGVPDALCARAQDLAMSGAGLSRWVDPRIGSYPPGFTNPGPTAPYGMVQAGPDTEGPINYGGYYQHNALVSGFSHVHMSAGVYKGGYIPVLPFTGTLTPGDVNDATQGADHPMPAYSSTFDHASESADAGYYAVLLSRYGVFAELTASERAGLHRYTFNDPTQAPRVLFDVSRSLEGYHDGAVSLRDGGVLAGRVHSDNAGGFDVYFAARLSEPFTATTFDGAPLAPGGAAASGDHVGAILDFPGKPSQVLVKVGLSYTDEDGALANLDAEIPGWDFDAARAATSAAWDAALARVRVEGGTPADRVSFYTALYHAQQFPNVLSDVDGRYRGPDRQVHADIRPHYSQFSSWDSYRGQNALQAEIAPERYADMIRSLIAFAQQNGGTLPRWQEGPRDASHMSGDPIIPFIGEAWCRGQLDADTRDELWPQMAQLVANRDPRLARLGYLPVDPPGTYQETGTPLDTAQSALIEAQGGSGRAGTTLEYGIADFSLALMAQSVAPSEAGAIAQRSLNYRNLLDPSARWIRPRYEDGGWLTPFAPELGYGFQEGTSWQYSWLAMHDVAGLVARMGGDDAVNTRLDEFFNLPADAAPVAWPTVQNQATAFGVAYYGNQYAPGNEHDLEAPYLYNYTGEAWKSALVARAAASIYAPTANGLPGNDDLGALSGWLVWTMAGIYPINPGTPLAVIGSPVFQKVTFKRADGDLVIEAPGASSTNKYVQSVMIDSAPSADTWLLLPRKATTVRIALGATPNLDWGKAVSARPPSLSSAPLPAFGCAAMSGLGRP